MENSKKRPKTSGQMLMKPVFISFGVLAVLGAIIAAVIYEEQEIYQGYDDDCNNRGGVTVKTYQGQYCFKKELFVK